MTELPTNSIVPEYSIPPPPAASGPARWVAPGESVQVAGLTLPDGMLYVGTGMATPSGEPAACLINGTLRVADVGDCRNWQIPQRPNYAGATPGERRAYLDWLVQGRAIPDCNMGYVFLFFYGLERRVLIDWQQDRSERSDKPAILAEIRRLLTIYGDRSGSFRRQACALLDWIELDDVPSRLYEKPIPNFPKSQELPFYLRLAVGTAIVASKPLSASLALAWLRMDPNVHLHTPAMRYPTEFEQLFALRYHEAFGTGYVPRNNRTKLKFIYRAASAGLRNMHATMAFGDTPDVTAGTNPTKSLEEIARQCTDELGPYSRLLGREPTLVACIESLVLLPPGIWPVTAKARLDLLVTRTRNGPLTIPLEDLLILLGPKHNPLDRKFVCNLARTLESAHIGMEPNVLVGAKAPTGPDKIILFAQPAADASKESETAYQIAALTLQLAVAMAQADWCFSVEEAQKLHEKVDAWVHLTARQHARLHACIHWLTANPPTLAEIKHKLAPLTDTIRQEIAAFMVVIAEADGYVVPEEVAFLEKACKALGIEAKSVFGDLQTAATDADMATSKPKPIAAIAVPGFHLDMNRVAKLQEDTARVSAFLAGIFTEEPTQLEPPIPLEPELVTPLDLDDTHAALVRLLLSRPQWTRAELEDVAADLDLLLDGALEQINDAAFAAFDAPLCEGDDPIDVDIGLWEKIEA